MSRPRRQIALHALVPVALLATLAACDSKESPVAQPAARPSAAPAAEEPPPRSPPVLAVDDVSPLVRGNRGMLTDGSGKADPLGLAQLKKDLSAEKEFLAGKELTITVDRKARPEWVATFVEELASFGPTRVWLETSTRPDYPGKLEAISQADLKTAAPCSLVGAITADRGTAIWRVNGGTARKRGRGMGGPDLTMTGDTIVSMAKGCKSDLFVVGGAEGVEWGLVHDLAASGLSLEKAGLRRVHVPVQRPVPGNRL